MSFKTILIKFVAILIASGTGAVAGIHSPGWGVFVGAAGIGLAIAVIIVADAMEEEERQNEVF